MTAAAALSETVARVRAAQQVWVKMELRARLAIVRKMRTEIASQAPALLDAFATDAGCNRAERLAAELIPLAEACRFLEQEAEAILAPRKLRSKGRPFWLRGIEIEERREALGVVLIISPANYPLFLAGVQALQALVAGNGVFVKPGQCGGAVMSVFERLAHSAGVPADLLIVLDEGIDGARAVIAEGVDKIAATGSLQTGQAVYRQSAEHLTPVILELSGCDAVFIQAGANLERAADAIAFGLRWNGCNSCIAPQRLFVDARAAESFERLFWARHPEAAALLPIRRFENEEEALGKAAESSFALGASIFGRPETARALAARVQAGVVVVNDMIVPTADPRVAFGGRGGSGFGTTRGAEGLRQFTALKVLIVQRRRRLRHLEPLPENAEELFSAYLAFSHVCGMKDRLRACRRMLRALSRIKTGARWAAS